MSSRRLGVAHRTQALVAILGASLLSACLSHTRAEPGVDAGPGETDTGIEVADSGLLLDAFVPTEDGGTSPSSCAPADASAIVCPSGICDGFDNYVWDGERCIMIPCGTCVGPDCEHAAHSIGECQVQHATCEPQLCTSTGGEWLFFAEECQHFICGQPTFADCLVGMPICDCGPGRSFAPGTGCFDDATCPEVDPLPPESLCNDTGGTWTAGICCSPHCGVPCAAECLAPACVCGATQDFDPIRGCVDTAECHVRPAGDVCNEAAGVRCEDGLLCCQRCGGAGCDPEAHCQAPLCDGDPDIDECGNNLLAP